MMLSELGLLEAVLEQKCLLAKLKHQLRIAFEPIYPPQQEDLLEKSQLQCWVAFEPVCRQGLESEAA